jgi:hypothetical protein
MKQIPSGYLATEEEVPSGYLATQEQILSREILV